MAGSILTDDCPLQAEAPLSVSTKDSLHEKFFHNHPTM
jgi:hypothetical protein